MKSGSQLVHSPTRLPKELKDWLKQKAVENFRSMNGELIARLEQSRKEEEKRDAA